MRCLRASGAALVRGSMGCVAVGILVGEPGGGHKLPELKNFGWSLVFVSFRLLWLHIFGMRFGLGAWGARMDGDSLAIASSVSSSIGFQVKAEMHWYMIGSQWQLHMGSRHWSSCAWRHDGSSYCLPIPRFPSCTLMGCRCSCSRPFAGSVRALLQVWGSRVLVTQVCQPDFAVLTCWTRRRVAFVLRGRWSLVCSCSCVFAFSLRSCTQIRF